MKIKKHWIDSSLSSIAWKPINAWHAAVLALAAFASAGCAATIKETHYFATYADGRPSEPVNFFRLQVDGHVAFTNARYVAGFYDTRAVDLFFNEIKPSGSPDSRAIFQDKLTEPGTNSVLKPLSPEDRGAFVMLLSTNSDAISDAIGSFAESHDVANNIALILHADELRKARQSQFEIAGDQARASALYAELDATLSEQTLKDPKLSKDAILRALNMIARALNAPKDFKTAADAKDWIRMQRSLKREGAGP